MVAAELTWKEGYTPLYSLADLIAYDKQVRIRPLMSTRSVRLLARPEVF